MEWQWEYLRTHEDIFSDDEMPIAGFRREWDRANFFPHWEEQKYIFYPEFLGFMERNIVTRDEDT